MTRCKDRNVEIENTLKNADSLATNGVDTAVHELRKDPEKETIQKSSLVISFTMVHEDVQSRSFACSSARLRSTPSSEALPKLSPRARSL